MADTDLRTFLHGRSPAFVAVAQYLRPEVAKAGPERDTARQFARLLIEVAKGLPDSPELTAAARHLLMARDNVLRAVYADLYVEDD